MKEQGEPITMLTAYDYPSAKLAEEAKVDMILVGDSLGMVVLGYDSTVPVTVEDMIHHTKAVRRGAKETFIVTDMPFMSYHVSSQDTMINARRIVQESGAHALKVEGAGEVISTIHYLTNAGIPVVAHLGLTPQSVGVLGGYKVQGKDAESAKKLIEDAKKCEEAGAIALVLECVPMQLAEHYFRAVNNSYNRNWSRTKSRWASSCIPRSYLVRRKSCSEICEAIYVCSRGDCARDFAIRY